MRKFVGLTKRNLLIYFKDIQSIFFSMLTPIIVLVLYVLFLKGTFVDAIESAAEGLEGLIRTKDIEMLANGLLLTGILGSSMITVPYNTLITIVKDRENKIDYDISATPISRVQIILSYFTASALSAFIMASVIMTAGFVILSFQGNLYLTAADVLFLFEITLLGSVSATALFMIVVLFFQSSSASGAFLGILSAGAGFVIGAYIPISQFSGTVQTICNIFPGSGITILYRNGLLNRLLEHIDAGIGGVDEGLFVKTIKEVFVFKPKLFDKTMDIAGVHIYIIGITLISVLAISIIYPKVYKRK